MQKATFLECQQLISSSTNIQDGISIYQMDVIYGARTENIEMQQY